MLIISQTWDPNDPGEESLERDFLIRDSESEWQLAGKSNPVMQLPVKTINKHMAEDKSVRLTILVRIIPCNL
jgi:hypothetical protein